MLVKKSNGETEEFSSEKLERSLYNAGADILLIPEIIKEISLKLFDGITTRQIYSAAFSILKKRRNHTAAKYRLKQALMEIGPTGHPFEHFISKVMEIQGYKTDTALVIDGHCVTHEVDVIATKNRDQFIVECKYGQSSDKTVGVQVPLYVKSRVDDIVKKREKLREFEGFVFHGMVATNTRFSSDSIAYSECSGLHLLGWDYPAGNGLKDIIDREKVYPVTVLNSLTKQQKQTLLKEGVVICRDISKDPEILSMLDLKQAQIKKILTEIEHLCLK